MTAPAPAHPHAHTAQRPDGYARRRPEETVLYQTIAEHWPSFSERLEEHGGLPRFVEREFEAYLRCGILDFGFLELECRQCGHSQLVALSCKKRGWVSKLFGPSHERQCGAPRAFGLAGGAHPSLAL